MHVAKVFSEHKDNSDTPEPVNDTLRGKTGTSGASYGQERRKMMHAVRLKAGHTDASGNVLRTDGTVGPYIPHRPQGVRGGGEREQGEEQRPSDPDSGAGAGDEVPKMMEVTARARLERGEDSIPQREAKKKQIKLVPKTTTGVSTGPGESFTRDGFTVDVRDLFKEVAARARLERGEDSTPKQDWCGMMRRMRKPRRNK